MTTTAVFGRRGHNVSSRGPVAVLVIGVSPLPAPWIWNSLPPELRQPDTELG